jgi:hypothetical protein
MYPFIKKIRLLVKFKLRLIVDSRSRLGGEEAGKLGRWEALWALRSAAPARHRERSGEAGGLEERCA